MKLCGISFAPIYVFWSNIKKQNCNFIYWTTIYDWEAYVICILEYKKRLKNQIELLYEYIYQNILSVNTLMIKSRCVWNIKIESIIMTKWSKVCTNFMQIEPITIQCA